MFKIEHLTFRYPNQAIFADYHAQISGNTWLYGPNGCGKTTLLRLLGGILVPQDGTIVWKDSRKYRASVLLNENLLYDDIRFDKQLSWICSVAQRDRNWLLSRCDGLDLEPLLPLTPGEMSQGMRRWATIAFVCAMPADVYLLDEPLAALDADKCLLFHEFLKQRISQGDSFVITGHHADGIDDFQGLTGFELHRGLA